MTQGAPAHTLNVRRVVRHRWDMRLEDYTPDSICQAMGLKGFIEPSWAESESPTLRVVLTPSFHPELCITFTCGAESAWLSVVALGERFWAQRADVFLPSDREQTQVPSHTFEEVVGLFQASHSAFDPNRRFVCCDGMGSKSCLVSRASTQRLDAHVREQGATGTFIARLIEVAWSSCQRPRVRNSLAQAAWYLDIKYPLENLPPDAPITRLAVLGKPEDRNEYLEMLRRRKKNEV